MREFGFMIKHPLSRGNAVEFYQVRRYSERHKKSFEARSGLSEEDSGDNQYGGPLPSLLSQKGKYAGRKSAWPAHGRGLQSVCKRHEACSRKTTMWSMFSR